MDSAETLKTTPLTAAHIARGGKMVPFGGYAMPVQYPLGILKEHLWTREPRRPVRRLAHGAVVSGADGAHR